MKPIIEIREVSKKYSFNTSPRTTTFREELVNIFKSRHRDDTFYALKDISFDVQPGESIGIIGRNGAGKTTLLKILSRITLPTTGHITVRGSLRSILEVGTGFHPELTGRENIFLNGAIHGLSRRDLKLKFDEIVDFSGLEKFLDTPFKHYSSGMMMRLAFSVISHIESDIFISDEVLAVGDTAFREKSLKKMQDVFHQGRTIIFVSHFQSMVSALTKKCVLLDHGKITAIGPTEEVLGKYFNQNVISHAYFENNDPPKPEQHAILMNVGIYDTELKTVLQEIDIDSSFAIKAEFEVLLKGKLNLEAVIQVRTASSDLAFMSTFRDFDIESMEPGKTTVHCIIPKNVLNSGQYFVSISLITTIPFCVEHFMHQNCISFNIVDPCKNDFINFYGEYTGICNPDLEWKSEKLP